MSNHNKVTTEEEYQFILKSLNHCLSELIEENEFEYCYRIQLEQHDLIVKDDENGSKQV